MLTHVTLINTSIALQETHPTDHLTTPVSRSLPHLVLSTTTVPVYATAIRVGYLTNHRRRP
jgi:hypothetical protein